MPYCKFIRDTKSTFATYISRHALVGCATLLSLHFRKSGTLNKYLNTVFLSFVAAFHPLIFAICKNTENHFTTSGNNLHIALTLTLFLHLSSSLLALSRMEIEKDTVLDFNDNIFSRFVLLRFGKVTKLLDSTLSLSHFFVVKRWFSLLWWWYS